MILHSGDAKYNYPVNWEDYQKEIDALLRTFIPNYETKHYITPGLYLYHVDEKPGKFPLLKSLRPDVAKRYVSYFLKDQGRIARGSKGKTCVWVHPDAFEVTA